MKNLKIIVCLLLGISAHTYAQKPPAINDNVANNSFRNEYWANANGETAVDDYEKAKKTVTDKSKLKDILLNSIYNNEQQKKQLETSFDEKQMTVNKLKVQLSKITDKESSKYKKTEEKLETESKALDLVSKGLVKNMADNNKLQEEYQHLSGN